MKIPLIVLSVFNVIILLIVGIGSWVASASFGSSDDAGSALFVIILAGFTFCIILPWVLHSIGKRLAPLKASIMKWVSFGLMVLPLLIFISWQSYKLVSNRNELPLKPPSNTMTE